MVWEDHPMGHFMVNIHQGVRIPVLDALVPALEKKVVVLTLAILIDIIIDVQVGFLRVARHPLGDDPSPKTVAVLVGCQHLGVWRWLGG